MAKKQIKWCWIATEVQGGFRLKLAYGPKDYTLPGLVLKTEEDVKMVTDGKSGGIVFVHLKNSKFAEK